MYAFGLERATSSSQSPFQGEVIEVQLGGSNVKSVFLKCKGDVTLTINQGVEPLPPNDILGNIENTG